MYRPSLEYIAAFLDADGCIGMDQRTATSWKWRVAFTNTHLPTLEAIQSVIGGNIYKYNNGRRLNPKHTHCYLLLVCGRKKVRTLLSDLAPYMITKREKAEQMLLKSGDKPKLKRLCGLTGCGRRHCARGLCSMHYQRAMLSEQKVKG